VAKGTGVVRDEWVPILGADEGRGSNDEEQDCSDLDDHDHRVEAGRFFDAHHQDGGDEQGNQHRGQIDDGASELYVPMHLAPHEGRAGPRRGHLPPGHVGDEGHHVA